MNPEDLYERYPVVFHVAFAAAWEGIQRNGLLSAQELAQRLRVPDDVRHRLLSARRPVMTTFKDPTLGRVTFRDHRKIARGGFGNALVGVRGAVVSRAQPPSVLLRLPSRR